MAVRAMDLDDDASLVMAVQAGDTAAYDELFRRHHTAVRRVCARRLGDAAEADEVAQAAFVRAFERIDRCQGDRRFGAWVQVIAHRLCIDSIRLRTRTRPDAEPVKGDASNGRVVSGLFGDELPEDSLLRRERAEKIHEALRLLPERQREVIMARHIEGRRPPEIAAALGLSVGAVDSLLLRARRRLAVSYQGALAEGGIATVPATLAGTALTTGAASISDPSRLGRLRDVISGLVNRFAALTAGLPTAGPGPIRTATVALVAASIAAAPIATTDQERPRPKAPVAGAPAPAAPAVPTVDLPTIDTPSPEADVPTAGVPYVSTEVPAVAPPDRPDLQLPAPLPGVTFPDAEVPVVGPLPEATAPVVDAVDGVGAVVQGVIDAIDALTRAPSTLPQG